MEASTDQTAVGALRRELKMTLEEFAQRLDCTKSHAHDLGTGRRRVTQPIAVRLEALSGRPWHEWMSKPDEGEAA